MYCLEIWGVLLLDYLVSNIKNLNPVTVLEIVKQCYAELKILRDHHISHNDLATIKQFVYDEKTHTVTLLDFENAAKHKDEENLPSWDMESISKK